MTNVRHILGISGGKDSAALIVYLKRQYFTNTMWTSARF